MQSKSLNELREMTGKLLLDSGEKPVCENIEKITQQLQKQNKNDKPKKVKG